MKIFASPAGQAVAQPVVAMDSTGDYVVAWTTYSTSDISKASIVAHRYNSAGVSLGNTFTVTSSTNPTNNVGVPVIAMDAAGDFVVVWSVGNSAVTNMIYAQRYNFAGVVQGAKITVNPATIDSHNPAVAMDATGDFVVEYSSYRLNATVTGSFVQRFNSSGVPQGNRLALPNSIADSSIAMDSAGDFTVAAFSHGNVVAERFNSAGIAQGALFDVYVNPSTLTVTPVSTTVSMDQAGDFVVAWQNHLNNNSGNSPVMARRYNAAGTAQGTSFVVGDVATLISAAEVVSDARGNFTVFWDNGTQGYVQSYSAAGVAQGSKVVIDPTLFAATINASQTVLAMDSAGDFVVVGSEPNASYLYDIYMQRFRSANPITTNHAPVGAPKTATTLENVTYAFKVADFGFTDPNDTPPNALLAVKITTLPLLGNLTDNNAPVAIGAHVPVADIMAGKLKFMPAAFGGSAAYVSFTFQVQDNGGTASGGVDTDPTPRKMTMSVTSVTQAPVGTAKTVTTLENTAYNFAATDFGFTDPHNSPANTLTAVKITALPVAGTLKDNGVPVKVGQLVSVADLNGGKLVFTPVVSASGAAYAKFTFQVQDNGSIVNGGVNIDPTPKTMTINVTHVNQTPIGTAKTVTTAKNMMYSFKATDFGFTDPHDTPTNTLLSVKITTMPVLGKLTDNGVLVVAGAHVSVGDITAGKLKFTPATNGNGTAYTSFTFQVQDNGGTANSGVDTDVTPKTMTISVT